MDWIVYTWGYVRRNSIILRDEQSCYIFELFRQDRATPVMCVASANAIRSADIEQQTINDQEFSCVAVVGWGKDVTVGFVEHIFIAVDTLELIPSDIPADVLQCMRSTSNTDTIRLANNGDQALSQQSDAPGVRPNISIHIRSNSLYRFNSTESVLFAQQDVEHREEDSRFRRIADFPGFVGPSLSSVLRDHEHRRYPFHGAPDDIYNITSSQPSLLLNAVPQVASGNTNHLTSPGVESVLGSQESYHLVSPRTDLLRRLDYELLDPQLLDILQSESFWSSQETDASPERSGR